MLHSRVFIEEVLQSCYTAIESHHSRPWKVWRNGKQNGFCDFFGVMLWFLTSASLLKQGACLSPLSCRWRCVLVPERPRGCGCAGSFGSGERKRQLGFWLGFCSRNQGKGHWCGLMAEPDWDCSKSARASDLAGVRNLGRLAKEKCSAETKDHVLPSHCNWAPGAEVLNTHST